MKKVAIKLTKGGNKNNTLKVNGAFLHRSSPTVVAIVVDLKTRHASLDCAGSDEGFPIIVLSDLDHAGAFLEIKFTEYDGWMVWSATQSKYSILVCLTNDFVESDKEG